MRRWRWLLCLGSVWSFLLAASPAVARPAIAPAGAADRVCSMPYLGPFSASLPRWKIRQWVDFSLTFGDADGYRDIRQALMMMDRGSPWPMPSLMVAVHQRPDGRLKIGLRGSPGPGWVGYCRPREPALLRGNYAAVDCKHSTVARHGEELVVTLRMWLRKRLSLRAGPYWVMLKARAYCDHDVTGWVEVAWW